jgi:predicted nucleic acid-binding protein
LKQAVLLDSGPLSVLTQPPGKSDEVNQCQAWLASLQQSGIPVYLPELADFEVRRELLRAGKTASVARLDLLKSRTIYVPITTPAMRLAAELWAYARNIGRPTAGNNRLDADVILAAQALDLGLPEMVVATTNVRHLSRFIAAREWRQITP